MILKNRQHGAAIITALLVVALVATTVAFLLAQQSQALTRIERTSAHAQAQQYASATLDWARAALLEDQRRSTNDHLNEAWAQSLFAVPIEGAVASGALHDEAGLFNLNNLIREDGVKSEPDAEIFRRLLSSLKLSPELANALADWIDKDSEVSYPGGAEDQTYLSLSNPYRAANRPLLQVEEILRVRGIDQTAYIRLRPFVTALPVRTRLNLNTAPQEVLVAFFPTLDNEEITQIIASRQVISYRDRADIRERLKKAPSAFLEENIDAKSDFFSAMVSVSNDQAEVRLQALFRRQSKADGWPSIIWVKNE